MNIDKVHNYLKRIGVNHGIRSMINKSERQSIIGRYFYQQHKIDQIPIREIQASIINNDWTGFKEFIEKDLGIKKLCHKIKLTKKEADEGLKKSLLSVSAKRKEKRNYYCEQCKAWHLTSKRKI